MSLATPRRSAPVTAAAAVSTREDISTDQDDTSDTAHDALLHVESECVVTLKRARENDLDAASVPSPSASKRARVRTPTPTPPTPTSSPSPTLAHSPPPTPTLSSETPTPTPPRANMGAAIVESVDITVAAEAPSTPRRTSSPSPSCRARSPASSTAIATPPRAQLAISTPSPASPGAVASTPKSGLSTPSNPSERPVLSRQRGASTRLRIETPHVPVGFESATRRSQITPPPSDRMLDRRNPPQPPRKAKKRRRLLSAALSDRADADSPPPPLMISPARVPMTRLPRLTSDASPTPTYSLLAPPPSRVFRSLESEFDAVADEPSLPLRLRSPPAVPRVTRILSGSSAFPSDPINSGSDSPSLVRVKPRATRVLTTSGDANGAANGAVAAPLNATTTTSSPRVRTVAVEDPQPH